MASMGLSTRYEGKEGGKEGGKEEGRNEGRDERGTCGRWGGVQLSIGMQHSKLPLPSLPPSLPLSLPLPTPQPADDVLSWLLVNADSINAGGMDFLGREEGREGGREGSKREDTRGEVYHTVIATGLRKPRFCLPPFLHPSFPPSFPLSLRWR